MAKAVSGPSTGMTSSGAGNTGSNMSNIVKYNAATGNTDPTDVWNQLLAKTSAFYNNPWLSTPALGLQGFEQSPETLTYANMNPSNGKFGPNPFIQGNGEASVGGILSGVGSFANGFTNAFTNALGGNTGNFLNAKLEGNKYATEQQGKKQEMTDKYVQLLSSTGVAPALDTWDKARGAYDVNAGKSFQDADPAADKILMVEYARTALNPTQRVMTDADALQAFESWATTVGKKVSQFFDNKTQTMDSPLRDQIMDSIVSNTNPYIKQGMAIKAANQSVGVPVSYDPLDNLQIPKNNRYTIDPASGQLILSAQHPSAPATTPAKGGITVNFGYKDMDSQVAYKQAQTYQYKDARTGNILPLTNMISEYAKAAKIDPDITKWTPEMKQQFFKDITGAAIKNGNGTTPTNTNPAFTPPGGQ